MGWMRERGYGSTAMAVASFSGCTQKDRQLSCRRGFSYYYSRLLYVLQTRGSKSEVYLLNPHAVDHAGLV